MKKFIHFKLENFLFSLEKQYREDMYVFFGVFNSGILWWCLWNKSNIFDSFLLRIFLNVWMFDVKYHFTYNMFIQRIVTGFVQSGKIREKIEILTCVRENQGTLFLFPFPVFLFNNLQCPDHSSQLYRVGTTPGNENYSWKREN